MKTKLCTVCNEADAKYKCPKCNAGYCSVACYKVHKTEPCVAPDNNNTSTQHRQQLTSYGTTNKSTLPLPPSSTIDGAPNIDDEDEEAKHQLGPEDLDKLQHSERVKELLANPAIRSLLDAVRKDPNPVEAIRILRQRPDFELLAQALIDATKNEE
ncbi:Zinc finger HIT domain-containing protein 3 [Coemansia sp. RSA 1286]|nr:Zinc finger HIT domain-containing protein 3 [Coemansia sp. RSA 1286]